MHLSSPNYKKAKGPYEIKFNKGLPSVLKTKPAPNTRKDRPVTKETSKKGGKYTKNIYRKVGKKEILGKERVIYKADGSNKEYVKSKDTYVPVTEYKKLNRK